MTLDKNIIITLQTWYYTSSRILQVAHSLLVTDIVLMRGSDEDVRWLVGFRWHSWWLQDEEIFKTAHIFLCRVIDKNARVKYLRCYLLEPFGLLYHNFGHHYWGLFCHHFNGLPQRVLSLCHPHCIKTSLITLVIEVCGILQARKMDFCLINFIEYHNEYIS